MWALGSCLGEGWSGKKCEQGYHSTVGCNSRWCGPGLWQVSGTNLGKACAGTLGFDGPLGWIPCFPLYGLAAVLGIVEWFDQLARPLFPTLDEVYAFTQQNHPRTSIGLQSDHLLELHLVLALAPLWEADLTRPRPSEIEATDASASFGFGISILKCSPATARRVGRPSAKQGDYVRLHRSDQAEEPQRDRIGTPHHLGIRKDAFATVISSPHRFKAHPGSLEASALVLLFRWLCRSQDKQGHRVTALVDAKVVIGAAAKGRTSAAFLKRPLRQLAALTLAGDFLHLAMCTSLARTIQPIVLPGVLRKLPSRHIARDLCLTRTHS
jgi:hypothetical protein